MGLKLAVANLVAIAKAENIDNSYVRRMVNLTTLAPDIQAGIWDKPFPDNVSLSNVAVDLVLSWKQQRGRIV